MKYLKLALMAVVLGLCATSCMDDDWKDPTGDMSPFGNNQLQETNVISIADLKAKYASTLNEINGLTKIEDGLQIKGIVTGTDVEGNIYNQVMIDDGTAGMIICVASGGINGQLVAGQEILVNVGGLYIGTYRTQPQIGVPYTNTEKNQTYPSRMNRNEWQERFKVTNTKPVAVAPLTLDLSRTKNQDYVYSLAGRLVSVTGVEFAKADGKTTFAPESEGKSTGFGVMRDFKGYASSSNECGVRTSCYADFAAEKLPQGKLNITGILTVYKSSERYNATVQMVLRQYSDITKAE